MTAGRQETTGLTDDVASVSGQVGALSTRVDGLAQKLDQLQQQIAGTADRRAQMATLARSVAQLDDAIEQGEPFGDLLDGLRGQEDAAVLQAVEQLQPAAASGVPSLAALRSSFDAVANPIVHAARAPEGDGLFQQAAGNLMSLVTVRPVGADVEGDGAAARVARAEAALERRRPRCGGGRARGAGRRGGRRRRRPGSPKRARVSPPRPRCRRCRSARRCC